MDWQKTESKANWFVGGGVGAEAGGGEGSEKKEGIEKWTLGKGALGRAQRGEGA